MTRKNAIIHYVRNKKGEPLGIIVAVKGDHGFRVGYSLCNRKDRFVKDKGLKIAFGRADVWSSIPEGVPREILAAMPSFLERCKKYYRTQNAPELDSAPF